MITIQLSLADEIFTLHLKGSQLVGLFHHQQAITFESPKQYMYEFDFRGERVGLDTCNVDNRCLAIYINQQFAHRLVIPTMTPTN